MLVIDKTKFANDHEGFRDRIVGYLCSGHGRWRHDGLSSLRWMLRVTSPRQHYNNPFARVAVCEALVAAMREKVGEGETVWLLSASPRRFGHDPENGLFGADRLGAFKDWIGRELFGLSYVGAIEGGWYGNYLRVPFEKPRISFHFHTIVWAADRERVKAVVDRINRTEHPFVSGMGVAHYKKLPSGSVESYVRYVMKAPTREYRLIGLSADPTGVGSSVAMGRTKKRPLRPGAAVRMMGVIGNATLRDYAIAGGQGEPVVETAFVRAREQLAREEVERQRRIERAVWGD